MYMYYVVHILLCIMQEEYVGNEEDDFDDDEVDEAHIKIELLKDLFIKTLVTQISTV